MKKPSPERGWAFLCAARAADAHAREEVPTLKRFIEDGLIDYVSEL